MFDYIPILGKILDKVIPDPTQKAAAQIKILELQQAGEFKELDAALQRDTAQIDLNKIEAQADDKFKSRWRPAIGWICVFGLGYSTILYPILTWLAVLTGITAPPNLGMDVLMPIILGMLGLGGMRSYEKYKGITK